MKKIYFQNKIILAQKKHHFVPKNTTFANSILSHNCDKYGTKICSTLSPIYHISGTKNQLKSPKKAIFCDVVSNFFLFLQSNFVQYL